MARMRAKLTDTAAIEVSGVPPEMTAATLDEEMAECRALWEDEDVRRLCGITNVAAGGGHAVRRWAAALGAGERIGYGHVAGASALWRALRHHEDDRLAQAPQGLREAIVLAWGGRLEAAREGLEQDREESRRRTLAQCEALALRSRAAGQTSTLDAALEALDEALVKGDGQALARAARGDATVPGAKAGESETARAVADTLAPLEAHERAAVQARARQRQETLRAHPDIEVESGRREALKRTIRHIAAWDGSEPGGAPCVRCPRTGRLAHPVEATTPAEHGASFADEMGALGRREALARYRRATGCGPEEAEAAGERGDPAWTVMRTLGGETPTPRTARMYREAPAQRLRHASGSAFALDASEAIAVERAFAGPCIGAPALSVQAALRTEALMSHGLERESLEEAAVRCASTALRINAKWMSEGAAWKDANGEASVYEGLWVDGVERVLGDALGHAEAGKGAIESTWFDDAIGRIDDVSGGGWERKATERVLEHGRACAERAAALGAARESRTPRRDERER